MSTPPLAPPRFAEGGGTAYECQLLASARRDDLPATPRAAERRSAALQAALAAARDPAPPGAVTPRAGASGVASWAPAIVGLGVVSLVLAVALLRPGSTAPAPGESVRAPVVVLAPAAAPAPALSSEPAPELAPAPDSTPTAILPTVPGPEPRPRRSDAARHAEPVSALPKAHTEARQPGLSAEVRAIEHVQTLLGWGETAQAARALSDYRQRFPGGELSLEADLLDIDLAVARGDRTQAAALARALLRRPAASGYRERLNELVGGAAAGNSARAGSNAAAAPVH